MSLRATFDNDGFCRVVDSGGSVRSSFATVYEPAFNSQYPPPLSLDGEALYVGTWDRGLFCYRVADGSVLWRRGPGKVRRIFPIRGAVVVEMADRGIVLRTQDTGTVTKTLKMSRIEIAQQIAFNRLFAGPHRRRYLLLELPTLDTVSVVPASLVNPDACLSFIIRHVSAVGDRLVVRGFEEYPGGDYGQSGQRQFERQVRPCAA